MKCKHCGSLLLSLYYRDNQQDKRSWKKTKYLYCKKCKKIINQVNYKDNQKEK